MRGCTCEGGSNTAVGLAAGLRVIPVALIDLYAGVMIDRFGCKRVLLVERWLLVAPALVNGAGVAVRRGQSLAHRHAFHHRRSDHRYQVEKSYWRQAPWWGF